MTTRTERALVRAQLACQRCRARKVRCSAEWPTCRGCRRKEVPCCYPAEHPDAPEQVTRKRDSLVPSKEHIERLVDIFFDYYGSTFFGFLVRHRFLQDLASGKVPLRLLLAIIALASRFYEPFSDLYNGKLEASKYFAELAREELRSSFEEPDILNLQCYLILALVDLGSGCEQRAWLQLGLAIRITHVLRLNVEDGFARKGWADAESKRRTFWCCFMLDRLMSNGADRPSSFRTESITTNLPLPDADFILERQMCANPFSKPGKGESLLAYTIRIVDILGSVVCWSAGGGRDVDNRCPWDDMPFRRFDRALDEWMALLPEYMQFNKDHLASHVACRQGNLFALMHMFYYHARCYLHREYIPFIPPPHYQPENGPIDGLSLQGSPQPDGFWYTSIQTVIEHARKISQFFSDMVEHDLAPWAYPFTGICLMTAATFHVCCSICTWKSYAAYVGAPAKKLLAEDLRKMTRFQEVWTLAAHWLKSLRRYYERMAEVNDNHCGVSPDTAAAAQGILQLVIHPIQPVNEVSEAQLHVPPREYDIYALTWPEVAGVDSDTSEQVTSVAAAITPSQPFQSMLEDLPYDMASNDDFDSFSAFLLPWE